MSDEERLFLRPLAHSIGARLLALALASPRVCALPAAATAVSVGAETPDTKTAGSGCDGRCNDEFDRGAVLNASLPTRGECPQAASLLLRTGLVGLPFHISSYD